MAVIKNTIFSSKDTFVKNGVIVPPVNHALAIVLKNVESDLSSPLVNLFILINLNMVCFASSRIFLSSQREALRGWFCGFDRDDFKLVN